MAASGSSTVSRETFTRPIPLEPLERATYDAIHKHVVDAKRTGMAAMEKQDTLERIYVKTERERTEKASPEEERLVKEILLSDLRGTHQGLAAEMEATLKARSLPAYNAGGKTAQIRMGMPGSFNLKDITVLENLKIRAAAWGQFFADDLIDDLSRTIATGFYDKGLNPLQVGQMIAAKFDEFSIGRANATARTETLIAVEQAQFEVYKTTGVEFKDWACSFRNSRQTHMDAHGQRQRMDAPFTVGAYQMMHPGDPSAGAEELVHCQCTFLPVLEGVELIEEDIWDGSQR